ncbi:hypothetical protein APY04_0168 [Hyphomicrobium sulfonivorans]|uniref:Uncharacterized protein n=1 Tax=Hyphomicrobium sulfonivorans TaxID=121290 RepID=A0A120CYD6_HYPSL|nr:head-tail adaptor protein [Hyphomicrobium sulfonivorans]KWT72374.1 hypothetical protein APY04_0168 [Hyphomicrobium sulfonivorans]
MIGGRRERISVKRRTRTQRADGGFDVTPTVIATRWASVRPVQTRADEREQAGRLQGSCTYLIEIDNKVELTADDVIVWDTAGGAEMNVREVRREGSRPFTMQIVAELGTVISG